MTAESDLEAYFGGLAATLGFHAGAWAAESPPGIVDALALSRKHDAAIGAAQGLRGMRRIIGLVEAFRFAAPASWRVAAIVYLPHRWPELTLACMHRCGAHKLDESHTEDCGRHGTLAGLVGLSERVDAPTPHARMMAVEEKAAAIVATTKRRLAKPSQHEQAEREARMAIAVYFAPLRREAEGRLDGALTEYGAIARDAARVARSKEIGELRRVFG